MWVRLDYQEKPGHPSQVYESESQHANAALVARVVDLLENGRAGLVTDVDGTISPIELRPEDARVLPRACKALEGLRTLLAVTAVVSGRTAADARRMVGVDGLTYVGNHGLEIWSELGGPQIVPEARPWVPRVAAVLDDVLRQVQLPGVLVENKGATGSLHYRMAADPDHARTELLAILARRAVTSGLRIEEGRMVINLLPPLMVTKGSVVTWLVRENKLERVVYLGDDVTDAYAFRALAALRHTETVQTLSIGVVGDETPASVRQFADATLPSVDAVADLLCQVYERLRSSVSMDERAPTLGRETHGQGRARD
jgi:trehalose 6-phosphate phosphatase